MLENLLEEGLTVKEVSAVICVAERTIFRQVNGYNLSDMNFKNFKHLKRCRDMCKISLVEHDYI